MTCIPYRKENVAAATFHPTQRILALLVAPPSISTIEVYRIPLNSDPISLIWSYRVNYPSFCLCWSPCGKYLCTGDLNGTLIILELSGSVRSSSQIHKLKSKVISLNWKFCKIEKKIREDISKFGIYPKLLEDLPCIESYPLGTRGEWTSIRSKSGYIDPPILLSEFSSELFYEYLSLLFSLDEYGVIWCSIGGHTPLWNLTLGKCIEEIASIYIPTNYEYVIIGYSESENKKNRDFKKYSNSLDQPSLNESLNFDEDKKNKIISYYTINLVNLKHFKSNYLNITIIFAYNQYMRQLLTFLKLVFQQLNSVWKTSVKPLKQLLQNLYDEKIPIDEISKILKSLWTGIPLSTNETTRGELNLNMSIDQLVMIGQNIQDGLEYIKNMMAFTIYPTLDYIKVLWGLLQSENIIQKLDTKLVESEIERFSNIIANFEDNIRIVVPITHIFLHLISCIKSYYDENLDIMNDNYGSDNKAISIILSEDAKTLKDTFGVSTNGLDALLDYFAKQVTDYKSYLDGNIKDLFTKTLDIMNFKNIENYFTENDNSIVGCRTKLSSLIDKFYKSIFDIISLDYIKNMAIIKLSINPLLFCNFYSKDFIDVSLDTNGDLVFSFFLFSEKTNNIYIMHCILQSSIYYQDQSSVPQDYSRNISPNMEFDLSIQFTISSNYKSYPWEPKIYYSQCSITEMVNSTINKIHSIKWYGNNDILILLSSSKLNNNQNISSFDNSHDLSTKILHINLKNFKYNLLHNINQSIVEGCKNLSVNNNLINYQYKLTGTTNEDNLESLSFMLQDIGRITRHQKHKLVFSPQTNLRENKSTILNYHALEKERFYIVSDPNTGRIGVGIFQIL
ncbi:hypothetical protein cand_028490 [Cryptosporidium andersoni]|uniref:Anaphase-promoting complex subunit 4 n=1 Tax=Cryptosporidium andersoni TaxID=117008 RepID=A0A1J4MTA4_9CRYT|nr:hypothetical protein cand_028490 [Cryptosporidium andersoni]